MYTDADEDEFKAKVKKVNDDGTFEIKYKDADDEDVLTNVLADSLKLSSGILDMLKNSWAECFGIWIAVIVLFVAFIIALFT